MINKKFKSPTKITIAILFFFFQSSDILAAGLVADQTAKSSEERIAEDIMKDFKVFSKNADTIITTPQDAKTAACMDDIMKVDTRKGLSITPDDISSIIVKKIEDEILNSPCSATEDWNDQIAKSTKEAIFDEIKKLVDEKILKDWSKDKEENKNESADDTKEKKPAIEVKAKEIDLGQPTSTSKAPEFDQSPIESNDAKQQFSPEFIKELFEKGPLFDSSGKK